MRTTQTKILTTIVAFIFSTPAFVKAQVISIQGANMTIAANTYLTSNNITTDPSSSVTNQGIISLNNISNAGNFTGSGIYNVAANISNTGSFLATTATVNLNGTSTQNINAWFTNNQLYNLIISNTNSTGVSLSNSLEILNSVSYGNVNNVILNTGGYLTLKSSATNTALIADVTNNNINNGNTINGNVTVERYIPANNLRGYRFIAPSVNSTASIHANWQQGATSRYNNPKPGYGTHITGSHIDQANGFDGTITAQPSLYRYDVASNNYIPFTNTDINTLNAKTAYLLFFRGDRTINLDVVVEGSSNTTLNATGTLAQGNQTFSGLVANTDPNGGFNLIANPYAAPISWNKLYAANSGISKYYTYYDNRINGGSFVTVDNTGTKSNITSAATVDIQSGEAFWIQASTAIPPTFTITENAKSVSNNINVFKPFNAKQSLSTSLFVTDHIGRRNVDGALTSFDDGYNNNIDNNDADEIENFNENIALNTLGHHLAIEQRPITNTIDTIHLYMSNMNQKNYDFQFDAKNLNSSLMDAILVDKYTGLRSSIDLNAQTIIPFTVNATSDSQDTGRFYILLHPVSTLPVTLSQFYLTKSRQGISLNWLTSHQPHCTFQILRSSGPGNFEQIGELPSTQIDHYVYLDKSPIIGNNIYKIKTLDQDGAITYSENRNIIVTAEACGVQVYPNPILNYTLKFSITNVLSDNYKLSLINSAGLTIYTDDLKCAGTSNTFSVKLAKTIPKGIYTLRIGAFASPVLIL